MEAHRTNSSPETTPLHLTIFGASGGTGRQLVDQGLAAGHHIVAVVRDPARLPVRHERLRIVTADVLEPTSIVPALAGADAVLSVLGPRSRRASINAAAVHSIVQAMQTAGVRRIVALSAAPVAETDPGDTFVNRRLLGPFIRAFLKDHYADLAAMEDELRRSDLDWTVVRPPKLTNKAAKGEYRSARNRALRGAYSIARADLAASMLGLVADDQARRAIVAVAY